MSNIIDNADRPILFFDGVCNLCNRAVQFIARHDKKKRFLFATLQSDAGKTALEKLPEQKTPDTVVLLYRGNYFIKSDAALHALRLLGGGWQLLYAFIIIPRFLRDIIYDFISRNRYKWFGKRDECVVR